MRFTPYAAHCWSTFSVPSTFTSASCIGSRTDSLTLAWAATWKTASGRAASNAAASAGLRTSIS